VIQQRSKETQRCVIIVSDMPSYHHVARSLVANASIHDRLLLQLKEKTLKSTSQMGIKIHQKKPPGVEPGAGIMQNIG
jgi:hypothetical protein